MQSSRAYFPDTVSRMTSVLELATKELGLAGMPIFEKERLATCILSVGNTYSDVNRLLEKSVRLYLRARSTSVVSPAQRREFPALL